MLIRLATLADIPAWKALSTEYDPYISEISTNFSKWYQGFDEYITRKIEQYEAVIAIDRMSEKLNGAIAFSRTHNRITFFAVSSNANHKETAERLLTVALRQLNSNENITINLPIGDSGQLMLERNFLSENGFEFVKELNIDGCPMAELFRKADNEIRGKSFHYRYPKFIRESEKEFCPCVTEPDSNDTTNDIIKNDLFWVHGEYPGQGRLFGKICVIPQKHYCHFDDMPEDCSIEFMLEVQRVGKALRKITEAVKINYEMHANTGNHIHIHLFPRYLDDDFPSAPIDYRVSEPTPYESYDEYLWFIEQMKKELRK